MHRPLDGDTCWHEQILPKNPNFEPLFHPKSGVTDDFVLTVATMEVLHHITEISSNVAAALTQPAAQAKSSSSNTMNAYDMALAKSQAQSQSAVTAPPLQVKEKSTCWRQRITGHSLPLKAFKKHNQSPMIQLLLQKPGSRHKTIRFHRPS